MSNTDKSIGFSIGGIIVAVLLVAFIYGQVSPILNGGGGEADMSEEAVAKRIAPVGELNTGAPIVAGAEEQGGAEQAPAAEEQAAAEAPAETVTAEAGQGRSGQEVYQSKCFACHGTGASGAPKLGDAKAWAPRIEKGMDALMNSAMNGVPGTAMLPKGTCNDCSEEEIRKAVEYMVGQSS